MTSLATLKTTPLFEEHKSLGAKLGPFAGWLMPIQYEGILSETLYTRRAASVFDVSHMGEFLVKGDYKKSSLDSIVTARIDNLAVGACKYSSILNSYAGVVDDIIIYRKAQEEWMIIINASTIEKDKQHFKEHLSRDCDFKDLSQGYGKIDIQGPLSGEVLRNIAQDILRLKYYTFMETDILGEKNIVSRTGYTGELGFEIYASYEKIRIIWKKLLQDKRVKPAGLGARDVLRLEMGYNLYGQDIDEETSLLEAGLERFIDFNKEFIGKEVLLKQKKSGLVRRRIFVKTLSRRSPRHNHAIYLKSKSIGAITSGTFSPHLEKGIGMGFVNNLNLKLNQKIRVGDDNLKIEALVTEKPFITNTSLKFSNEMKKES